MTDEKTLLDHIIDIKESQARTETKVDLLVSDVNGNGHDGLKQRVGKLENQTWWVRGIGSAVVFFLGVFEWLFHRGH